jgi:hypothetical protein
LLNRRFAKRQNDRHSAQSQEILVHALKEFVETYTD